MFQLKTHYCHNCRKAFELDRKPGRRDECPHCTAELHACRNCRFFDASLARGCRETQAEEVPDLSRANFCNFFEMSTAVPEGDRPSEEQRARAGFDALFGKGPAPAPRDDREQAKAAFEGLFGKK